jgi:hypothetical protein
MLCLFSAASCLLPASQQLRPKFPPCLPAAPCLAPAVVWLRPCALRVMTLWRGLYRQLNTPRSWCACAAAVSGGVFGVASAQQADTPPQHDEVAARLEASGWRVSAGERLGAGGPRPGPPLTDASVAEISAWMERHHWRVPPAEYSSARTAAAVTGTSLMAELRASVHTEVERILRDHRAPCYVDAVRSFVQLLAGTENLLSDPEAPPPEAPAPATAGVQLAQVLVVVGGERILLGEHRTGDFCGRFTGFIGVVRHGEGAAEAACRHAWEQARVHLQPQQLELRAILDFTEFSPSPGARAPNMPAPVVYRADSSPRCPRPDRS